MSAAIATEPLVQFDVDAMLMYGWVADSKRHVTHVSNSLRRWIRSHRTQAPEANDLLDRIDAEAKIGVGDFLQSLLDPRTEAGTAALVTDYMTRLEQDIVAGDRHDVPSRTEELGPYKVLRQYHAPRGNAQPLAGARFVRDSATLLASRWNAERVDIVVVAIVEQHDGEWKVSGFQGQLQEAWLRVERRIIDGNRAAGIALMARNMSHNIGSHALYWVASEADDDERRFLRYLQARMELLAGFATKIPLSPVTAKLRDIVERFNKTTRLLDNICRSEHVTSVNVNLNGYLDDVIFFGGEVGMHAFYSILENCIRDSAKHPQRQREKSQSLTMNVVATPVGGLVQIDVYDESHNYAQDGPAIQKMTEQIRLATESGALNPMHWGVKERFVCAAILRGMRPEEFPLQQSADPDTPQLGIYGGREERRFLELAEVDGNCSWRFYLPRQRADVLMVTDRQLSAVPPGVTLQSSATFAMTSNSTAGIVAPFVVLDQLSPAVDVENLRGALPHRTYVRGTLGLPQTFRTIDDPLESISSTLLLNRSVEALTTGAVRLIIGPKPGEASGTFQFSNNDSAAPLLIIDNESVDETIKRLHHANPAERFIVFKRHPSLLQDYLVSNREKQSFGVEHFEAYFDNPYLEAAVYDLRADRERAALRLMEAALTQILIIDERLDLDLDSSQMRGLLRLRGITVRGREFVGHSTLTDPTTLDDVCRWSRGFHAIVLHRGVAEKLYSDKRFGVTAEQVIAQLEADGALLAIHSGRMGAAELPRRTKVLPLANVASWIHYNYSKLQIVDELFSLRGV